MNTSFTITVRTLLITLSLCAIGWLLLQITSVIVALYISALITLFLTPVIDWAQKRRIPRALSAATVYIALLSIFATVGVAGFRPIAAQINVLTLSIPTYLSEAVPNPQFAEVLKKQVTEQSGNFLSATLGVFSNAFFVISILVFTFYLLVEFDSVKRLGLTLSPPKYRKRMEDLFYTIENTLGAYLRGQLLLGFIVGICTYIGLTLLQIEYALSLALLAGVLEIIPVIGPIISAIPALIVAIPGGWWNIAGVGLLYTLIQQLENNVLVPQVLKSTVGLNPLVTLLIILIGGSVFGTLGIILSVPTALIGYLILREFSADVFGIEFTMQQEEESKPDSVARKRA